MKDKRVGIYARVSTSEQNVDIQLVELRKYVQDRGWTIYKEYIDINYHIVPIKKSIIYILMKSSKRRPCA